MKRPRILRTQKDKQKEKNEFQTELGLGGGDLSEPIIEVQKVGHNGYIAEIPAKEVKELFGTLPEYLRVYFGSGEYKVTIRKKGKADKRRMKISVDPSKLPQAGDFNTMVTLLRLQRERAHLLAEMKRERDRNALISKIFQLATPFLEALAQKPNQSGSKETIKNLNQPQPTPEKQQKPQPAPKKPQQESWQIEADKSPPANEEEGAVNNNLLGLEEIIK